MEFDIRGEPDYGDQVPRMMRWNAAHPDALIIYIGPYWQVVIPEDNDGSSTYTRSHLRYLMDKLEAEYGVSPHAGATGPAAG